MELSCFTPTKHLPQNLTFVFLSLNQAAISGLSRIEREAVMTAQSPCLLKTQLIPLPKTPGQDPRVRGLRVFPSEHLQSQAAERAVCGAPGPVQIEDH